MFDNIFLSSYSCQAGTLPVKINYRRLKMSIKTILIAFLLVSGLSLGTIITGSSELSASNQKNQMALTCDPSQWIYVKVLIDSVWWVIVYDCDGMIINQYPAYTG